MTQKINSYFAVLLIVIAGSFAARIILHVAIDDSLLSIARNSGGEYTALQNSILGK